MLWLQILKSGSAGEEKARTKTLGRETSVEDEDAGA